MVDDWEVQAKNLKTEHDFDLDPRIKVALLTVMLLADLQDTVFQWSDGKSTYEEMPGPDRLHGDQQGVNEQACSNGGGQSGGRDVERGDVPPRG